MRFIKRKKLTSGQKQEIFELWNNEYPRNLKYNDIAEFNEYLSKLEDQNHILLIDDNGKIEGWYSDFIRDQERWFLAILNSKIQGKKFGTQILNMAKEANEELKGWVINSDNYIKTNGQPYKSPTDFYKKQGFQILEETKLETNRLSAIKIKWSKTGYNNG
ncbi:GNAT family N-acetyltransferase [Christiangramia sp. LLG6405-1]|uniref:GNAT family N-acetyltransferase n=1 Tax=Christiangramia sp. LLG6405-1 TaxID=3160832 RepID=UPI0038638CC5